MAVVCVISVLPALGQPEALTLEQCIDIALQNSPRLALAEAEVRAAQAQVGLARSAGGLHASIGGQVKLQGPVPAVDLPGRPGVEVLPSIDPKVGVTFELPIDISGDIDAARDMARAGRDSATAKVDQAREQLVFEVIRAYCVVLSAEALCAAADDSVQAAEANDSTVRSREEAGMATGLEVRHARSSLALAREQMATADNRAMNARAALASAMSVDLPSGVPLSLVYIRPETVPDPLASIAEAERRRPELAAALADLRGAAASLRQADAQDGPRLALSGGALAQRPSLIQRPLSGSIGLGLTWPILDNGREDALVDQAEARQDQAELGLAELGNAIELQVQQAVLAMADADVRIGLARDLSAEAERALEDIRAAERAGAALRSQVLAAQAGHEQALALETMARLDMTVSYAAWARATGRMSDLFLAPGRPELPVAIP